MANTNNFPTDITVTILLTLPRKSILRFKCVCESWRYLIEDAPFMKHHYYLNQILTALKNYRGFSIDDPIIPSVISHQLSMKFMNSRINGFFLLAVWLSDKIVFWNPEDLSESASVSHPILYTTSFSLGERIFWAKSFMIRYKKIRYKLEVTNMRKKEESSGRKMLEIEEPGPLFLKKKECASRDFLFCRMDKNRCVVIYDSNSGKLNEHVADVEAKPELKNFVIAGPKVSLFIDPAYAKALISPNPSTLQV